jgi:hypothetical protein
MQIKVYHQIKNNKIFDSLKANKQKKPLKIY